jgi:hypothetical protein
MALRYSGDFAPLKSGFKLPRVDLFELWNEPNVPTFLQPQWVNGRPVAADLYRGLVQAAYPAIKQVQPDATVLVGVTSPSGADGGGAGSPVKPLPFLRRLACVDARLHPVRDGACAHFRRVPGDGYSHHPYALYSTPGWGSSDPNAVRISGLDRITRLTTRLAARGRLASGLQDLWLTEFGYESNDPVRTKPWTLGQQARLLAQAEYVAQRNRHVRSVAQFLLRDVQTQAALRAVAGGHRGRVVGSWQTGLYFEDGRPKPSAASFRLTFLPLRTSDSRLILFGHVRPARQPVTVRIWELVPGEDWTLWTTSSAQGSDEQEQFLTSPGGVFLRMLDHDPPPGSLLRFEWQLPDGSWESSPTQPVQQLGGPPPP